MFSPLEPVFAVWSVVVPKYEWEPVVPQAQPTDLDGAAASPEPECQQAGLPPPLQLVFKGMQWHTYFTHLQRENGAWELCHENGRDQDEDRVRERRKLPPHLTGAAGPDTPQAPDAAQGTGLQDERNWP